VKTRVFVIAGAVVIGSLGLAACGGDDDDSSNKSNGGGSGNATVYDVKSLSYSDLSAPAGGTIEIDNTSGAPHTFTADDGQFDKQVSSDGKTDVKAPTKAGTYKFHCDIHSSMKATLTVTS
jgi:plastocyanin